MENINLDKINDYIANKEFSTAKIMLEDCLKEDEQNIEALKLLGLANVNLKLYDDARTNFETVVKYLQDDASSWFYLANCYDHLNDLIHAKSAYLEVIKLREEYIDAYKNLAIIYMKSKEETMAIEILNKASELAPEDDKIYFLIGTAYMSLKNFKGCIEYFEKVIAINPSTPQVYNNLGTAYITIGDFDKAYYNYEKAAEIEPENAIAYYNMGSILQIKGNHNEACELFTKAYEIEPSDNYLVSLALSEFKSQQFEKSLEHYKTLGMKYPDKPNFMYNIACCYEYMGKLSMATSIIEDVVATNPKSVVMIQKLAGLYVKMNQHEKAKSAYEHIIMQGSISADIYYEYAMVCMKSNDMDMAEKIFKKVLELNPNDALTHKDMGVIYLTKRLFEYAKDEFDKALELAPENKDIVFEVANFYHATTNYLKADEYYKQVLEKDDTNPNYLTFAAKNKMALCDNEAAYAFLLKALKCANDNEFILFLLGKSAYMMKDYDNAKLYLIKSYEINPSAETENLLALTYYELGQYIQANQIFLKILEGNPNNTMVLLSSAKCYEQIGDKDAALTQLEKAVEIFPDLEEAHDMIRKLS